MEPKGKPRLPVTAGHNPPGERAMPEAGDACEIEYLRLSRPTEALGTRARFSSSALSWLLPTAVYGIVEDGRDVRIRA
jgi:hypothetical protein